MKMDDGEAADEKGGGGGVSGAPGLLPVPFFFVGENSSSFTSCVAP